MAKDWRFGALTVCLFATGCFSYPQYGPPGTYAPPHSAMVPQPYGTAQVPSGTVWVPANPAGASTVTAPEPARAAAPTTFEDDHELPADKAVPKPSDPGNSQEESQPFGKNDDAKLDRPAVTISQRARSRPTAQPEVRVAADSEEPELADDDEPKLPRSNIQSAEFRTRVQSAVVTPASATEDQYGYDAEGYAWLQGVIEFDSKRKVWHLTYSLAPDDSDQFGGEVTLKNPEDFKYLRSGQVVSVEGQFDPDQRDRLGKPVYEVTRIVPAASR